MRRFEFEEGSSRKFWDIELTGDSFSVRFGRIGTSGQTQAKSFPTAEKARAEHDKLVREKLKKGYVEVAAAAAAQPAAASVVSPPAAPPVSGPALAVPPAETAPTPQMLPWPPTDAPAPARVAPAPTAAPSDPEDDETPRVVWTETARRRVHPRRSGAPAPRPRLDRAKLWKKLAAEHEKHADDWGRSEPNASEECARLTRAVRQSFASSEGAPGLDPEVEAARAVMLGANNPSLHLVDRPGQTYLPDQWMNDEIGETLVGYWIAAAGPAFALDALARSCQIKRLCRQLNPGLEVWLARRNRRSGFKSGKAAWESLRRHLSAAATDAFEAARSAAVSLRADGSLPFRCALSYAFPDEPWAEEDARAWLEADEASVRAGKGAAPCEGCLLASVTDLALADRLIERFRSFGRHEYADFLFTLVDNLGLAASGMLRRRFASARGEERVLFLEALAPLREPEVAAVMVGQLDDKDLRAVASEFLLAAPRLALRALAPAVSARTKGTDPASALLEFLVRAHPAAVEAVLPSLGPDARAAIESIRGRTALAVPEASLAGCPPVLASPPWLAPKAHGRTPKIVTGLQPIAQAETVVWQPGEKELYARRHWSPQPPSPENDALILAQLEAQRKRGEFRWSGTLDGLSDEAALQFWNTSPPGSVYTNWDTLLRQLARFDTRCFPGVFAFAQSRLAEAVGALDHVVSTRVAPLMAEALVRFRKDRGARHWLLTHPETAVLGLVPDALGRSGRAREAAEAALRLLASGGHGATVRAVTARYGAAAEEAVEEVLAYDPVLAVPDKVPGMPDFWNAAAPPRPLLRGREKALPLSAVEHLGTLLALSSGEAPHAGLEQVVQACDPASLGAFAWGLFEAWLLAGAPPEEKWAFEAMGSLGDDECARRLTPLLRQWPAEGGHARAVLGLGVLAAIGTDVALMHLHGIAQRARHKGIQTEAQRRIETLAEARGLTPEELADRLVPDLDLDPDGSKLLDFGARSFRVGFDEHLQPYVKDGQGKRLPELPKPGKADDKAKAKEAAEAWKTIKKDAKAVASGQLLRLELAMCQGRRWEASAFRPFLAGHPLVGHLVRRLVWATFDAEGRVASAFRVCEDGTFADSSDAAFPLADDATVGLPHVIELGPEVAGKWGGVLGDYEILQPFPQLGREVCGPTGEERTSRELRRVEGLRVPTGRIFSLEGRGWRRGRPGNSGVVSTFEKGLPGGEAELSFEPGWFTGAPGDEKEQTLGTVALRAAPDRGFGSLPPIAFSELVADLMTLKV